MFSLEMEYMGKHDKTEYAERCARTPLAYIVYRTYQFLHTPDVPMGFHSAALRVHVRERTYKFCNVGTLVEMVSVWTDMETCLEYLLKGCWASVKSTRIDEHT